MSLFKTYTPKYLFQLTLKLANSMFHAPPYVPTTPKSFFTATVMLHAQINDDLNEVIHVSEGTTQNTTIKTIHASICNLEKQLFGTETEFEVDIRGCCLYTQHLEQRLTLHTSRCVVS
jgi:hypothetical protein